MGTKVWRIFLFPIISSVGFLSRVHCRKPLLFATDDDVEIFNAFCAWHDHYRRFRFTQLLLNSFGFGPATAAVVAATTASAAAATIASVGAVGFRWSINWTRSRTRTRPSVQTVGHDVCSLHPSLFWSESVSVLCWAIWFATIWKTSWRLLITLLWWHQKQIKA